MKKHKVTGKVIHVDVGPGCWGIVEEGGREWRPVNMPEQLKHPHHKVEVVLEEVEEEFDIFMWGTPARVVSFGTITP